MRRLNLSFGNGSRCLLSIDNHTTETIELFLVLFRTMRVSVIGGSTVAESTYEQARTVGQLLGDRGHTVVCGGLGGVMEAVARGAKARGSRTIGVLPGSDPAAANDYIDIPIATGLGNARNVLVATNGDAAIAIDGSYGTLSEIALALDADLPVVGLETHDIPGVTAVETPQAAVAAIDSE